MKISLPPLRLTDVLRWFYFNLILLNDVTAAKLRNTYRTASDSYNIDGDDDYSPKTVDLTKPIVSGYDGARVDYDDVSGVIDRLQLNITSATHAIIPSKRLSKGRYGEPISSLCGLPATIFFTSDTLEMSDIRKFEKATGQQLPARGAVVIIFPTGASTSNTPSLNSLKVQPTSRSLAASDQKLLQQQQSSQAASIIATGAIQSMTLMRSRDVVSRDVAKYLATDRNISVLATNAHHLDHVSKHSNTLERTFLSHQVIVIRNIASPGVTAQKWLQNSVSYSGNLNGFVFIYEPVFSASPGAGPVKSTQQKALNPLSIGPPATSLPHGGRLALAGLVLTSPRRKLACLSLSSLNARALDTRTYRPIQTGFATEVEVSLQLRSPGHTYLSTPSSHQFLTASIPDDLKFGTCAKMPILVTRGVSSVVSVANLIAWENERRKGVTGDAEGSWMVNDQAILFQVISVGEEPPPNEYGISPTKLFIEPEVFTWLRKSRGVRIFGFDHQLDSVLGNKHEIESVLGQLDDTVTIYNIFNLANIRTTKTFTYSGIRNKRSNSTTQPPSSGSSGCNQFQCAFVSLRLWPASLAPVQLFAVSDVGTSRQMGPGEGPNAASMRSSSNSPSGKSQSSIGSALFRPSHAFVFLSLTLSSVVTSQFHFRPQHMPFS